jgi:hypothetical protein
LTCSFRLGFWPLNFLARAFSCILGEFVIFLWADLEGGEWMSSSSSLLKVSRRDARYFALTLQLSRCRAWDLDI